MNTDWWIGLVVALVLDVVVVSVFNLSLLGAICFGFLVGATLPLLGYAIGESRAYR